MSQIKVELQEFMGSDGAIANAAWTSTYDKAKREDKYDDEEKVSSLVKRLAADGHGVPFESVIFRFWIKMPLFTDRQHMTHRVASHNGISGRYRTMPEEFFALPSDVNDIINKATVGGGIQAGYEQHCREAHAYYRRMIDCLKVGEKDGFITNAELKRVREVLRGVLPQSSMLERTTIINLRSLSNFFKQRLSSHAQPEIRHVAEQMYLAVKAKGVCPVALHALEEKGWQI